MSANGWFQFAVFSVILLASVRPVGIYLARVLEGERTWLDPVLRPIERLIYKLCGVNADKEMNWREYAYAVLGISAVSLVVTYGFERLQHWLPWNPQGLANVGPDLAWNTAASFTTNTNWQSYVPETTMSYLTQMAGLAYHNFLSAAMGIAVAVALIRAIKRTSSGTIGNFWVDTTRTLLYVLLPASIIGALLLVAQGVPQNLKAYTLPIRSSSLGKRRLLRKGQWPRRKSSRKWAPTAADSSTPTAPIPSRTPRRSRTSTKCS
jgi:K+-transporting ATPase ATPase A chain